MKFLLYFFSILLFFSYKTEINSHPVHISVTNIDYNSKNNEFEIKIKLFVSDLETALNQINKESMNFGNLNENKKSQQFIEKYINNNLSITLYSKTVSKKKLKFIKKELTSDNSIWLYFVTKSKSTPTKATIKLTFLNELYEDQNNLMIFTCKDTQEAIKFDKFKIEETFLIQ